MSIFSDIFVSNKLYFKIIIIEPILLFDQKNKTFQYIF